MPHHQLVVLSRDTLVPFGLQWNELEKGILIYREEDLDSNRCRKEYSEAAIEDLDFWLRMAEGPDSWNEAILSAE